MRTINGNSQDATKKEVSENASHDSNTELQQLSESSTWDWNASTQFVSHRSYHELSDQPVVEMDALTQLKVNTDLLAEMQNRFSFVMREVRYLLKV